MSNTETIARAIGRVRRRVALLAFVQGLVTMLAVVAPLAFVAFLVDILRGTPLPPLYLGLAGGGVVLLGAVVIMLVKRMRPATAAWQIDKSHGYPDTICSSYLFLEEGSDSPFVEAVVADASEKARAVRPSVVVPIRVPSFLLTAFVGIAAIVVLPYVPLVDAEDLPGRPALHLAPLMGKVILPKPMIELTQDEQDMLDQIEQEVKEEKAKSADKDMQRWLGDIEALLEAIKQGKIKKKDAFAELSRLQNQKKELTEEQEAANDYVEKKLSKAAKHLDKHKKTKPIAEAMQKGELDKVAEQLKKLTQEKLKRKDEKKIADAMKKMAKDLEPKSDPKGAADAKAKQELKKMADAIKEAADQLKKGKKGDKGKVSQAMDKVSEAMKELKKGAQKEKNGSKGGEKLSELKDMLKGNGKQGKKGKKGGSKGSMQDFFSKAGGKKKGGKKGDGKGGQNSAGKDGDKGSSPFDKGGKGGDMDGPKKLSRDGAKDDKEKNGAGSGHDPNVMGPGTKINADFKEDGVGGVEMDEGPKRSQIIYGAASKGFTGKYYKKVHQDYKGVVEERIEKEKIPQGYKTYIKKYFDMIRPKG